MQQIEELGPGEIGFITAAIKESPIRAWRHHHRRPQAVTDMLPGFKPAIPVVFCGLFPVDADDFETLRAAMGKLRLTMPVSPSRWRPRALGFGFRCGFLGLLHWKSSRALAARVRSQPDRDRAVRDLQDALTDGQVIEDHNPIDMPDV